MELNKRMKGTSKVRYQQHSLIKKKKVKKKDMEEKTWMHITINEEYKKFLDSKQMKCSEKADDRVLHLKMKAS